MITSAASNKHQKDCVGPRNQKHQVMMQSIDGWHGKYGHCNVFTRDHDSIITNFGRHDRVIVSLPSFDTERKEVTLYMRVDGVWGLGMPSAQDMLEIARKEYDIKGKWALIDVDQHDCGNRWDVHFVRMPSK